MLTYGRCGPFKLAYILNQCLDRYENPDENIEHQSSASESPRFNLLSDDEHPVSPRTPYHVAQSDEALTQKTNKTTISDDRPSAESIHEDGNSGGAQVLIVDDNSINRSVSKRPLGNVHQLLTSTQLLVAFMKRYQYTYAEAENGLEALEMYQANSSSFQTILMDMSMPGTSPLNTHTYTRPTNPVSAVMDGMTSTRAIRFFENSNNLPRCRIVALTGLASASARLEALSSGVDHFMTKPMNFRGLEGLLKRSEGRSRRRVARRESMDLMKRGSVLGETRGSTVEKSVVEEKEREDVIEEKERVDEEKTTGGGEGASERQTIDAVVEQADTTMIVEQEGEKTIVGEQGDDAAPGQEGRQQHEDGEKHDPDQCRDVAEALSIRPVEKAEGGAS